MRFKQYLLLTISFFLLSGNVFSQSDEKKDNQLGLTSDGGVWGFYQAKERKDSIKHILLIGDSVMHGYRQFVTDSLADVASVDRWATGMHLNSSTLFAQLAEIVSARNYDVIHFNIGLHGWQEGRIPEGKYASLLDKYVTTIREHAPKAKLIWASITPVTELNKPELNKEINPIIVERNQIAAKVMNENGVLVNDLYGLMADKLSLARLDRFHWNRNGYELMANQCVALIRKELETVK
ncbi:MAG: SGNH/GDSL hydrolase family protein [Mangrovibacterium sp.]